MVNIEFAKEVVTCYLTSDNTCQIYVFLNELGISKKVFDECIKVIKVRDIGLYDKYVFKHRCNNIKRYYQIVDICKDLALGIKTGKFKDGTDFDMLEFYRRIPFVGEEGKQDFRDCMTVNRAIIESKFLFGKLDKFTEVVDLEINEIIVGFVRKNMLYRVKTIYEMDLKILYGNMIRIAKTVIDKNGNEIIIDKIVTIEDIDKVINYMKINKLPFIIPVFQLVLEKYFIGEVNLEPLIDNVQIKVRRP